MDSLYAMNNYLETLLLKYWDHETSHDSNWTPGNPSLGQCAITSLVIQEILGGEIARIVTSNLSHYFNVIAGNIYDFTEDQFEYKPSYYPHEIVGREDLLSNQATQYRHEVFRSKLMIELEEKLPVDEIEHVSIRDPNYVAGTSDRPEVKVFCQTNKKSRPIKEQYFAPNQNVYMKWCGGPIVAKSELVSWHCGEFHAGNVNKLRELTVGTNLFGLSNYWQTVSEKDHGFYSVIHLANEAWLDSLLFPTVRSHGSSWIYLDTILKKIQWLSLSHEPKKNNEKGRSIPAGLRFFVLKRDSFTCKYCGRTPPSVELHVDHVVPWSKVKEHKAENLVTSCRDCNLGKSNKEL
jgi:hypothetical protein